MSRPEAKRRAREVRSSLRAKGEPFTKTEFFRLTMQACEDLDSSALEGLVTWAVDQVDEEATRDRARRDQPTLFEMDGDYNLGHGLRIGKEHAQLEHMRAMLRLSEDNVEVQRMAHELKVKEFDLLRPYLSRPGMRKAEAVAAYIAENGEEPLSGVA